MATQSVNSPPNAKQIAEKLHALPIEKRRVFRERLAERGIDGWRLPIVPFDEGERKGTLSRSQARLLSVEQKGGPDGLYHLSAVLKLSGELDLDALRTAFSVLLNRHQILRTTYQIDETGAHQSVMSAVPDILEIVDELPDACSDDQIAERIAPYTTKPFDLSKEAPIRAVYFPQSDSAGYLLVVTHHIAFDAWSEATLVRHLLMAYIGASAGQSIEDISALMPNDGPQFADYSQWEADWLESDAAQLERKYWSAQLSDLPESIRLPVDRSHRSPTYRTHAGAEVQRPLDADLTSNLKALASREDTTLYVLLQAAFSLLLSRYGDQDDLIIGTTTASRARPELEKTIGFLVNTLPLRHRIDWASDFSGHVGRTKAIVSDALGHQLLPFDEIVDISGADRATPGGPLFQTLFVYQNVPPAKGELAGLEVSRFDLPKQLARFHLTLRIVDAGDRVRLDFEYSTELFDEMSVQGLLDEFVAILEQVVVNPAIPLTRLELRNEPEPISGATVQQTQSTALDLILSAPDDASALILSDRTVTYGELRHRAASIASRLRPSEGTGRVAINLEPGPDQISAMIAAWMSGSAWVVLDQNAPPKRLSETLDQVQAELVIGSGPRAEWAGADINWLDLSEPLEEPLKTFLKPTPEQSAYIIMTSGSTGRPKPVEVPHKALVAYVEGLFHILPTEDEDVFSALAASHTDLGFTGLFGALLTGRAFRLLGQDERDDPQKLASALSQAPTDLLKITPSHLQALLDLPRPERILPRKTLILGGEAASTQLIDALNRISPDLAVWNHYGPAEATIGVAMHPVDLTASGTASQLSQVIPGTVLQVFDQQRRPTPLGAEGELWISGSQLANGYLGQPAETNARFTEASGRRWYRTGDRVRRLSNKTLQFIGRSDEQVKVRGFRVELAELEQAAIGIQGISAAAACLIDVGANKRLSLVVTSDASSNNLTDEAVRAALSELLPPALIPHDVIVVEQLPMLGSGKIDRKSLRALFEREAPRTPLDPAGNQIALQCAELFSELLGQDIGLDDGFFASGGDSLLALQLSARARKLGLAISPLLLFENPTPRELSLVLGASENATAARNKDEAGPFSLSPIQSWFFGQDLQEPGHWNQSLLLEIDLDVDVDRLTTAVSDVIAAYPMLRTGFKRNEQGWSQEISVEASPKFEVRDLASDGQNLDDYLSKLQRPFDLAEPPLLRVAYIRRNEQKFIFLTAHHLIVDTVSWRILLDSLLEAYSAGKLLGGETTTYQQWIKMQHEAPVEVLERARTYAASLDKSGWPFKAAAGKYADAKTVSIGFSKETTSDFQSLSLSIDGGPEAVLLTALSKALGEYEVPSSCLVELERHGRNPIFGDLSGTIGWHTSRFPVALRIPDHDVALEDHLGSVSAMLRAIPDDGIGFGILRYFKGELADLPEPKIVLNYQGVSNTAQPGVRRSSHRVPNLRGSNNNRARLIDINGGIDDGELNLAITVPCLLNEELDVSAFSMSFKSALEQLVSEVGPGDETPALFDSIADQVEGEIETVFPLTPIQTGMLLHSLSRPDSGAYINQLKIEFEGTYSIDLMEQAWSDIVARHDILRAGFHLQGLAEPMHAIMRDVEVPFRVVPDGDVDQIGREDISRGFAFTQPPLMRLSLVTHTPSKATLVWTRHHLITDGWSTALVLKEVQQRYFALALAAQTNSAPPQLPAPALSFGDFATWRAGQDDRLAREYWKELLDGVDEPVRLPKRLRSSESGAREIRNLVSKSETNRLKALAAELGVTLGAVIETAFALALDRFGAGKEVIFGQVLAGRPLELDGIEQAVGAFLNTVPVRAKVTRSATPKDFARQLHRQTVQAQTYGGLSLSDIQSVAGLGRDAFDALFIYENYPTPETASLDEGSFRIRRDTERNVYPLTLMAVPGDELALNFVQERAELDNQTVDQLIGEMRRIISKLCSPDDNASTASLYRLLEVDDFASKSSLGSISDYGEFIPMGSYLCGSAFDPDLPAIGWLDGDDHQLLSRAGLEARSNRLAHHLISLGVERGERVCLDMLRGPEMMLGLLAVLKAGAAYVPLEQSQPAARRRYMADAAKARFVLHQAGTAPDLGDAVQSVVVDAAVSCAADQPETPPDVAISPDDIAYVMFTSGSTGQPKGVAVPHAGLWNRLRWMQEDYAFGPGDRTLQKTPYSFDVSVSELFLPLLAGSELIFAPPEAHKDPVALRGLIDRFEITTIHFVPSMLSAFVDVFEGGAAPLCPTLKRVICTGEAFSADLGWRAINLLGCGIYNLYGPTEASIEVTHWDMARPTPEGPTASSAPIGPVIPNMAAYVLDQDLQPVPEGVAGELYLSGVGLAHGYEHRADLTAAAFLPNPFATDPSHSRMYRTGDLARWRGGVLEYLSRVDFQIKLRGQRIELGEIENVLEAQEGVSQAVVTLHPGVTGERLIAYIVSDRNGTDSEELAAKLAQSLPTYMIPAQFVDIEALPLTTNGKLDRKALPAPDVEVGRGNPPQTETEIALAEIWSDILGVHELSSDDHFFFIGGHSLLLPRLLDATNRRFGTSLGFIDIALALTITAQAEIVNAALAHAAVFDAAPEDDSDEDRVVFDL